MIKIHVQWEYCHVNNVPLPEETHFLQKAVMIEKCVCKPNTKCYLIGHNKGTKLGFHD